MAAPVVSNDQARGNHCDWVSLTQLAAGSEASRIIVTLACPNNTRDRPMRRSLREIPTRALVDKLTHPSGELYLVI